MPTPASPQAVRFRQLEKERAEMRRRMLDLDMESRDLLYFGHVNGDHLDHGQDDDMGPVSSFRRKVYGK
ncbi:hypothetical protein QBC39DRAFT_374314 [Podospora conica]|nr:hypothetical protein QBC39DRAFT_374314 [Schizothecium conicum]